MSTPPLRTSLQSALHSLATGDLRVTATAFLATLGYASQKTLDFSHQPQAFVHEVESLLGGSKKLKTVDARLAEWRSAAFLFQLTNDELPSLAAGQTELLLDAGGVQTWQVESFVFLALDLKPGTWTRTQLAVLTREVNRLFPMPAILLFRHLREDAAPLLSVSVIHRRTNKRDSTLDVVEDKVSLIKDIDLRQPHAAHLRILEKMALAEVDEKYVPSSFEQLYKAWLKVLDVKVLNNSFYDELAHWYYWAVRKQTGVVFPKGQPLDDSDDPVTKDRPTVALIRLLTRLIFVWFLKEKRLVPAELFDETALARLLNSPPHQHDKQGNYYRAILQNLFFATLNTEMTDEDENGHKQRVWREAAGFKRMDKYLIHTVYRYKSEFKDADRALALFRKVPFLNGGLFECLDKLVTAEDLGRDDKLAGLVGTEGKQTVLRVDGFSERPDNAMHIPNELFFSEGTDEVDLNAVFGTKNRRYKPRGLLNIFNRYKFTIEENTPIEEEVALDPELLGKVFENLLASYNPDTKTTARKKSGSFYTPREVVDYMVDEALVCYLEKPLAQAEPTQPAIKFIANGLLDLDDGPGDLTLSADLPDLLLTPLGEGRDGGASASAPASHPGSAQARLRRLLSYRHASHDFSTTETRTLIAAIEQLRVLDPACGSGAFPMGMLQKLVAVLRKLDPDNALWKAQNRAPLQEQLASAKKIRETSRRDEAITLATEALKKFDADFADSDYADYARKLYLIEKCLYGVDIQPIAVQIAKLRFFISLVVEQKLDARHLRLNPLPNLETKIVAANTLLPIPRDTRKKNAQFEIVAYKDEIEAVEAELRDANASHFAAKRFSDKRKRKERILSLRDQLSALLKQETTLTPGLAEEMAAWDPFNQNRHADFFDPEWMFGFKSGFDIVIGNPPYVRQESIKEHKPRLKPHYPHSYSGTADLYVYFYERSFQLLSPGGALSFITSNKWFRAKYGADLRQYMTTHAELRQIIDFGDEDVFDALAYPTIVIATKRSQPVAQNDAKNQVLVLNWDGENADHQVSDFPAVFAAERFAVPQCELKPGGWQLEPPRQRLLLERLRKAGQPLGEYCKGRFYYGIKTGLNEAFVIPRKHRDELVEEDPKLKEIIKPFLRGRDVKRWNVESQDLWLIKIESSENVQHAWSGLPADRAEKKFAKLHPALYAWFTAEERRQQLVDRTDQGHYFWELRSCAYWDLFSAPKIVYPDIYLHQSMAWDESAAYCANTAYFIPNAEKWLTALLNSAVIEWFYDQISTRMQGGYLRAFTDKMQTLPIPNATSEQRQVIEVCIDAVRLRANIPEYERLLNGLIYELFFPEELNARNIRLFDACRDIKLDALKLPENPSERTKTIFIFAFEALAKDIRSPDKPGLFHRLGETIFHPRHNIYAQLFELQTIEVVRLIEGSD